MSTMTKSRPNIAKMAEAAQTAEQLAVVLFTVEEELAAAEDELGTLENRRQDVILNGENLEVFHRDLLMAREKVETFTMAKKSLSSRHEAAVAKEEIAALETHAASERGVISEGVKDCWRRLHSAMLTMRGIVDDLGRLRTQAESLNWQAERHGREDLKLPLQPLRAAVAVEIVGRPLQVAPMHVQRMGERIYVEVSGVKEPRGESDEAFGLREGNAQARAIREGELADPFKALGEHVLASIEEIVFDMDAHQRARNRRLVNVTSFKTHDGRAGKRITDTLGPDGTPMAGAPHKPQFGPYSPDGSERKR